MNMQLKADGDFVYQAGVTGDIIRVRVRYLKTQSMSRRGVYVSVEPWTITPDTGTGYTGESTILMSDASVFVERLARVKPSAVAQIAARLDAHAPAFASMMIREGRERTKLALQAFFTDGSVPAVSRDCGSTPRHSDYGPQGVGGLVCSLEHGHTSPHQSGAASWPIEPEPQPEPVKTPDGWSFI